MFLKWGMIFLRALIRIHHYKGLRTTQLIKILQLHSFIFVFHPKTFSKFVALNHNKMHRWRNHTNQPYNLINTHQAVLLIPFFFVIVTWIKTTWFHVDWEDLQLVSDPWDIAFSQRLDTNKWQEYRGHEPNAYHENSTTFGRLIFLDLRTQLTNSIQIVSQKVDRTITSALNFSRMHYPHKNFVRLLLKLETMAQLLVIKFRGFLLLIVHHTFPPISNKKKKIQTPLIHPFG